MTVIHIHGEILRENHLNGKKQNKIKNNNNNKVLSFEIITMSVPTTLSVPTSE